MNIPKLRVEAFVGQAADLPYVMLHPWLDVENSRLLATDGHMACRAGVTVNEGDVSGPVPVEAFELIRKEIKVILKINGKLQLPDPWIKVTCHEENVQIENLLTNTQHFVLRKKPVENKFPDLDKVFPKKLDRAAIALDRDLLSIVLASLGGDSTASLWISGTDKAVVVASQMSDGVAMLMPCTIDNSSSEVIARGKLL